RDFVETGTYTGRTAAWAAGAFGSVITIEASPELYAFAAEPLQCLKNVRRVLGDSREVLAPIVSSLAGPAVFWLDAHWSGPPTAGEHDECPLLEELQALARSPHENFVLIDDARLFLAPPPAPHRPEHWPSIDEVSEALSRLPHRGTTLVFDDVI